MTDNNIHEEIVKLIEKYPDLWEKNIYKKGKLLVKIGRKVTSNYYIESGILKAFCNNEEAMKEVIIGFVTEKEFVMTHGIDSNITSPLSVEVISDAVIYSISTEEWNELRKLEKITDEMSLQFVRKMSMKFIEQAKINAYSRAKTRYEKSLENYPCLRQVKNEYAASFLGLDPRTISRIKEKDKEI